MKMKKLTFLRLLLGIFFLIMAVIGFILPILQGWAFLLGAGAIFGWDIPKLYRKFRKFYGLKKKGVPRKR